MKDKKEEVFVKTEERLVFARRETLFSTMNRGIGSKMFRNCWCYNEKGELVDVCDNGNLSCAFYVSRILLWHGLVRIPCVRVEQLEKELLSCGWYEVGVRNPDEIARGSVIIWGPKQGSDGKMHRHAGFYLGDRCAVSHDSLPHVDIRAPSYHPFDIVGGVSREIERVYFTPLLEPAFQPKK